MRCMTNKLIIPLFQHTLYLGHHEEILRKAIKPILGSKVEDDKFIQQFSTIVARKKKRKRRLVKAKVNAVARQSQTHPRKNQIRSQM